jgi:hypothetical protein
LGVRDRGLAVREDAVGRRPPPEVIVFQTVRRAVLTGVVLLALTACSGDGEPTPPQGSVDRAVERLVDYGLTTDEAACVADALGPATVVEAGDINAFADSEAYRDAVEGCIDAG